MESTTVRICSQCGIEKSETLFGKRTKGIQKRCKACVGAYNKAYQKTQPKRTYEKNRHYYDLSDKAQKAERSVFYSRKSKYGITREGFFVLLEKQNNQCAICQVSIDKSANVDHCHSTGKVRGLLCSPCNKGLGHFKDNISVMKRATEYLEEQIEERAAEFRQALA